MTHSEGIMLPDDTSLKIDIIVYKRWQRIQVGRSAGGQSDVTQSDEGKGKKEHL